MAQRKKDIIIANPMYDVVFKHLMMSDKDTAKYFVGTILNEEIIDINMDVQEYTFKKEVKNQKYKSRDIKLIRLDFVATIRTKKGEEKKVLIEIQQAKKPADMARFRTYLGKQYIFEENDLQIEKALPIIVIYMLGFNIPQTSEIAVKIKRSGTDILGGGDVELKDPLFDALTHDAYFIQVARLKREMYKDWEKCSDLMKMLSLFQQAYFVDKKFLKKYPYPITDKNLKKMINTLEYLAFDPKIRRAMEEQHFAELDVLLWNKALNQKDNTITALKSNNTALKTSNDALKNQLAEYQRKYGTLNSAPNE